MELERSTFVTDAWSERSMRVRDHRQHGYYLVAVDPDAPDVDRSRRIDGYAGLLAPQGVAGCGHPDHRGRPRTRAATVSDAPS